MTTQSQLLAIEKGVIARAQRSLTDAYHLIQKPTIFYGIARTYEPKDDEGEALPGEATRVQQTVIGLVTSIKAPYARLLDIVFEKDATNLNATVDVIVDGRTLIANAPVTYLLWLEKRLIDLRTFVEKWPTLDPSEQWHFDSTNGVYRTDPTGTVRTQKVPRPLVKYDATDRHPAQVDVYNIDVTVGTWKTIKFSGATEPAKKQATLDRIDIVLATVRQAREAANAIDVATVDSSGDELLDYLFEPVTR